MKTLTPSGYIPRLIESEFEEYLNTFGAVEIDGPKWCGKTWTSLKFAHSVTHLDEWETKELVESDLSVGLRGDKPHLIDEWQELPKIRDAVRRAVDESANAPGSFILTGSTAPSKKAKEQVSHSGAGRIGRLRMRPMSLYEAGISTGEVSLSGLFEKKFEPALAEVGLEEICDWVCRGGWPANRETTIVRAQRIVRQYLDETAYFVAEKENKSGATLLNLIKALSRNLASDVSRETLIADIAQREGGSARISRETLKSYLELLQSLYLVENLEGWDAPVRSRARVRTKPKRYLVDPSLAAVSLGISPPMLLKGDYQTLGLLFETLCLRDLRVYAATIPSVGEAKVRYYRDDFGLEVDVIIELGDGSWGAIEIKLSESKVQNGIDNLLRLREKIMKNTAAKPKEPDFMMVLTGRTRYARLSPEGIYVVPISCLGA